MWVECVIAGLQLPPQDLQGEPGSWGLRECECGLVECVIAVLCISAEELHGEPGSWLACVRQQWVWVECVVVVLCISAEELQGEPGSVVACMSVGVG